MGGHNHEEGFHFMMKPGISLLWAYVRFVMLVVFVGAYDHGGVFPWAEVYYSSRSSDESFGVSIAIPPSWTEIFN